MRICKYSVDGKCTNNAVACENAMAQPMKQNVVRRFKEASFYLMKIGALR